MKSTKRRFKKDQKAMSLLEILITVGIFSFIVAAVYLAFGVGQRSWAAFENKVLLQREVRWALFTMVRELREARGILVTEDSERRTIRFRRSPVGIVSFSFMKKGGEANTIIHEENSQKRVIARNISDLSFDHASTGAVEVIITAMKKSLAGQPMRFQLKEKVTLRL